MVPLDPVTGETRLGPTAEQALVVLNNMAHLLESNGSSLNRAIKLNVSLANMLECDSFYRVMRKFFPADPPACTVVGMQLSNGHGVEIECVAAA
jgi:enamine deaminase RidA (YjgF/YER057c/UK114 family)